MCGPGKGLFAVLSLILLSLPAYAEEGEGDKKKWTGSVNLGIALTTGTTDSYSGNAQASAERAWESDTLTFGLDAIYGRADGDYNANNQTATTKWRHNFTEQFYSHAGLELGRDSIQLIQWHLVTTAGPGWRAWQAGEKRYLDLEAGVGYWHEEFRTFIDEDNDPLDPATGLRNPDWEPNSTEPDRDEAIVTASFEHANLIGDALEFKLGWEFLLPVTDTNAFVTRSELVGSVPLLAGWFFRTSFAIEYQNAPAEEAEEVNTTLTSGLEYRF